jgi:hypothetical protein
VSNIEGLSSCAADAESQASLLSDRDVVKKIKCLIDIERKLRLELVEHEKKVSSGAILEREGNMAR